MPCDARSIGFLVVKGCSAFFRAFGGSFEAQTPLPAGLPELPICTIHQHDQDLPINQVQFKPKKVKKE
jgi:hypothetical protein